MNLDEQAGRIRFGQVMLTLAAIGLMVVAFTMFNREPNLPEFERGDLAKPRVVVSEVGVQPFELAVRVVGRVSPWREVSLAPDVSGRVEEIFVDIGDHVDAGQAVLRIESDTYETSVREAEAAHLRARARLEESEAALARTISLRQRGAISEREYEAALATKQAAEADVATAEAGLERARRDLRETTLEAPFTGTIVERQVDPGALVGRDRTVIVLADLDTIAVEIGLTESEILQVRDADRATVTSVNLPGRVAVAALDGVAQRADPTTGTYLARFRVANDADPRFLGGMVVDVTIPIAEIDAVPTVPSAAVIQPEEDPHVFVIRDGRAVRVDFAVVARESGRYGIGPRPGTSTVPLSLGDLVVVVGQQQLVHGAEVEIASQR